MPLLTDKVKVRDFGNGAHMLMMWANVCLLEASEGVVVFDTGFVFSGPRVVEALRKITDKPVRYIVYGHGHADHAFGARELVKDAEERGHGKPVIIAHENLPKRFDRYQEMLAYHEHINRIQFDIPENMPAYPRRYIYPDLTYRDSMSVKVGDTTFELRHSLGETDDTTWMWVPEKKTVCTSDLWVWSCPNIGNPFKVQRFETEWANALEQIAAKGPELLLPGHGPAIEGKEKIRDACLIVAKALRFLHDQVVCMLNEGKWQEEILNTFEWPEEFAGSPYLRSIYGHPWFVVQGILRRFHGFYDGNPSHLFPAPTSDIGKEVLALVGDPGKILDRARDLSQKGNHQLALHLVDLVIDSDDDKEKHALELKAELLQSLADNEDSLIARNIYLVARKRIKQEIK
jgi:alkyl sulfatase BDS1-like metallo-beta-lactamase superfamily hydrolase